MDPADSFGGAKNVGVEIEIVVFVAAAAAGDDMTIRAPVMM